MNNSIKSGFKKQDEMTDGFFQSEITIIGATPASGKSAFIASCIDDICFKRKIPAMLFSLEMGKETISRKFEKINDKSIEAINDNRLIIIDLLLMTRQILKLMSFAKKLKTPMKQME